MGEAYDVIIVGGGHNGLTAAAYLAMGGEKDGRNKLKVLVLERYRKPGGAAMSDEIYPGFTFSTCSYVCSLLRPEIFRFLELPRHGLQVLPNEINGQPNPRRRYRHHRDHDRTRETLRRHSIRDAGPTDLCAEIIANAASSSRR
jgi:phytoene dehydrogenase-like protein